MVCQKLSVCGSSIITVHEKTFDRNGQTGHCEGFGSIGKKLYKRTSYKESAIESLMVIEPKGEGAGGETKCMMKLTCHELEGLGDLRLIGVGFRNGHFDRRGAERTERKTV